MTQHKSQNEFVSKAEKLLIENEKSIDAATLSRLNQARQAALDSGKHRTGSFLTGKWLPIAAAALLVITVINYQMLDDGSQNVAIAYDVADLMMQTEDPEFLDELEFVAWLTEEYDAG